MPKLPITFAAIITTGPSPTEDRVVEVGALRVDGAGQRAEFHALADPGHMPPAVSAVFGIAPKDVSGKPPPRVVLQRLMRFAEGTLLVVHDAAEFASFLQAEKLKAPDCLDLVDLARIATPTTSDFSASGLALVLELDAPQPPRALPMAHLLGRTWRILLTKLTELPPVALDAICRLAEAAGDPLAPILTDAATGKGGFELSASVEESLRELFEDHRELFRRVQKHEAEEPTDEPLPTEALCRMFATQGLIGRSLANYEYRREQVEMVQAVCDAFTEAKHLMVEAGTGTGKSLAYLLPAIAWACMNKDKVLVSTNTKNLQEQLYHKDLPFLSKLLPGRFQAALLKGRRNYLCIRRFVHVLRNFERELAGGDEYMALAPLLAWAAQTRSGDLAECNGFMLSPAANAVLRWIVTGPDECLGRACRFRSRCFVQRARALAQLADVIVINHALLFSEAGIDTPVLPPYRCLILDEAHNLEDVAADILGEAADAPSFLRLTNFLHHPRRDKSGSGLLATVMYEIDRALPAGAKAARDKLTESCGLAMQEVEQVVGAMRQFFEVLREPFNELPPYVERILLEECHPSLGAGSAAWDAAVALRETISSLGEKVEALCGVLEDTPQLADSAEELTGDLRSQVGRLRDMAAGIDFVLAEEEENYVYWLERTVRDGRSNCSLRAAPLQIGRHMREFFFNEKRCVVLTSATMQVGGSFDYMLERLGMEGVPSERSRCLAMGSPFDYDHQALVGVTAFLPDPGGQRQQTFDLELSSFLQDLLQQTSGRALVLFTSYSLLNATYEAIKEPLARAGITVLAQGHSGSREAITALFRSVTSSVLLGTRSFWEGVDISGETLSCLVLTKLPFHVFTDPLVRGRTEYLRNLGRDPFYHYTLPEAVISFRQGFGRLIRTRTDAGIVIITDRRVVTKAYGKSFLESLPTRHRVFRSADEALNSVKSFFERDEV